MSFDKIKKPAHVAKLADFMIAEHVKIDQMLSKLTSEDTEKTEQLVNIEAKLDQTDQYPEDLKKATNHLQRQIDELKNQLKKIQEASVKPITRSAAKQQTQGQEANPAKTKKTATNKAVDSQKSQKKASIKEAESSEEDDKNDSLTS